jgi:hypothetical protein
MRRSSVGRYATAIAVALCVPLVATACSSSGSPSSSTVAPGVAVLGAPYSVWVRAHPPVTAGGQSGYGTTVTVNGQSLPEFTDVRQLNGRVISMHLNLSGATHLATAEQRVRAQLPTDARQTASWRGTFPGSPPAYCEFVNYQSPALARSIGIPPPPPSVANIGTSLSERTGNRPGSSSIATVNSAVISTAANVLGHPC